MRNFPTATSTPSLSIDAGEVLDLHRKRAVRAALAIRQAAAAHDATLPRRNALRELRREPRLADARRAEDRDEVRAALELDAVPRGVEETDLPVASDERRAREVALAGGDCRCHRAPRGDRSGLALRCHRLGRLVLDRCARGQVRLRADDDFADRCVLLQPRRGVHDVACDHRLAVRRPRRERHDRVARVHRAADAELELRGVRVEGRDGVTNRKRRADSPFGIVPVRGRSAEDRHHGVADELLHDAAERLELVPHRGVVRSKDRAHVLRIELLGARREADEVDEDDADDPPLLAVRRLLDERGSAGEAKTRNRRVFLGAALANWHPRILAAIGSIATDSRVRLLTD